jgi:hypothetical protein
MVKELSSISYNIPSRFTERVSAIAANNSEHLNTVPDVATHSQAETEAAVRYFGQQHDQP